MSPNASTSSPRKIMSPLFSNSNLRSVPMKANNTGCKPVQACSNTCTTGSSSSSISLPSPSTPSAENTELFCLCWADCFLQPVPATNADMIHASGPAPGYPHHWLPVTAKNPPVPSRNDLLAVTEFSIYIPVKIIQVTVSYMDCHNFISNIISVYR